MEVVTKSIFGVLFFRQDQLAQSNAHVVADSIESATSLIRRAYPNCRIKFVQERETNIITDLRGDCDCGQEDFKDGHHTKECSIFRSK